MLPSPNGKASGLHPDIDSVRFREGVPNSREIMFFDNVCNVSELKTEYRKLCKIHHPDFGGKSEIFILLNKEYETFSIKLKDNPIILKKKIDKTKSKFYRFFDGHEYAFTILLPKEAFDEGCIVLFMNKSTGDTYITDIPENSPYEMKTSLKLISGKMVEIIAKIK